MKMETQHTIQYKTIQTYFRALVLNRASIILTVLLMLSSVARSQTSEWTVFNTANSGLPYNGVTALAIDPQGIVWVGTGRWWAYTGGGLARFDGTDWTVYNTGNSKLPDNDHTGLCVDAYGNIWSGTENGLSKFDGTNWTVYRTYNSGLPSNHALAPTFDADGNAWIATFPDAGLGVFDGENWTVYHTGNSGLPSNFVCNVTIDIYGNIWISTFGSGVAKFDGQNWTVYRSSNSGLPHNDVCVVQADGRGNVWAGTYGGGLARFDGNNWTAYTSTNSRLPHDWIWNLSVDSSGNAWAGTRAGLAVTDGTHWKVYDRSNSGLPDNNVYCTAFDTSGQIWIGTQDGGLVLFRPQPVVDFNGNGTTDMNDLLHLIESWGQADSDADIGPLPWGDGTVDGQDLELLMTYWGQEVDDPTLVAYWKLDETEGDVAYDSSAENDALVRGDPIWQPGKGQVEGALLFDGIDDYILTPALLNPAKAVFSIFAWVQGSVAGQVIICQEDGKEWLQTDEHGCLMTTLQSGGRRAGGPLVSDSVVADGNWHRVGFTWDGTNRVLYVDGMVAAEDAQSNLTDASGGLHIGANRSTEPRSFWTGIIDDVRVYNRVVIP